MTSCVTKLHSSIKNVANHAATKEFSARGGASIVEVGGKIIIFGGAERSTTHFQDMAVYNAYADSLFVTVSATGDVPMPRSGHSVVAFGKYMFLFGGLDFVEEAVFNDLYILNTETYEWGYVGESGAEVIARNSHSMGIISDFSSPPKRFLVIYGGASPEHGVLGDTLYAELPEVGAIDPSAIYVEWKVLPTTAPSPAALPSTIFSRTAATAVTVPLPQPGAREMHGTACFDGKMYISGGRSESGEILSDVWVLAFTQPKTHTEESKTRSDCKIGDCGNDERHPAVLQWQRCTELELAAPRCAHGSAIVVASDPHIFPTHAYLESHAHRAEHKAEHSTHHSDGADALPDSTVIAQLERSVQLVLIGGFTQGKVSNEIVAAPLLRKFSTPTTASSVWKSLALSTPIPDRFGLSLCPLSIRMVMNLTANRRYAPFVKPAAAASLEHKKALLHTKGVSGRKSVASRHVGMLLFGGVSAEEDFGDVYLIML